MSDADPKVRLGPNGRPVRPFVMPTSWFGRFGVWRYILARRTTQIGMLLLFFGTFHWGWMLFGQPLLSGNPSASMLLGTVPLGDPFATLQILISGQTLESTVLIGAGIVLLFYGLVGGRVWCAWFCPVNIVTDAAAWLRARLGIRDAFHVSRQLRYYVLALALLLSAITGIAAFEWVSPISITHRGVVYGLGLGWMALLGIFLFDLAVLRHGWCGHLCPLGAFYGLLGKLALLRVAFDKPTCTHCGECARVCPEPQVLNFKKAGEVGLISPGECSNCGRCIPVCPEDSLSFQFRPMITKSGAKPEEEGL